MKKTTHPSIETLCAYHDKELPEKDRQAVEAALKDLPASRALLEDFKLLDETGPRVEEQLPGETYWLDLPDRILARALLEEPQLVRPSWQRIFQGRGSWGWVAGATALLAVAGVSWFAMRASNHPVTPVVSEADRASGGNDSAEPMDDLGDVPEMSPETYAQRVLMTLGAEGDPGESLDMPGGSSVSSPPSADSPLHQVSITMDPESRADLERVVCNESGGSSPLETVFICALKAEEAGRYDLARQGYAVLIRSAPKDHPIYWQADFRLTFHKWANRMENAPELQRVRMMDELNQLAHQTYVRWQESGQMQDCQKAYCLNRTLVKLVQGAGTPIDLMHTSTRVDQLQDCIK